MAYGWTDDDVKMYVSPTPNSLSDTYQCILNKIKYNSVFSECKEDLVPEKYKKQAPQKVSEAA